MQLSTQSSPIPLVFAIQG